jgi:hypothetical protein
MVRSGQSIFSRPKPIDLSSAQRAGYTLDIDIEDDDDEDPELGRPLIRDPVIFDAEESPANAPTPKPRTIEERDEEDLWAELG